MVLNNAGMAKLVDARDSKSRGGSHHVGSSPTPGTKKRLSGMSQTCLFCNIISQQIPATVIAENADVLVIRDIAPKAPVHYLIIPKKHSQNVGSLEPNQISDVAACLAMAAQLSKQLSGSQSFRLISNSGADSGQSVFHTHFHFLSGKKMTDF